MRRSYRHHLILFLIICDTWKSLWYFIFPLVIFTRGKVQSSSKFCQASGFFLSLGLELSDLSIFFIALHTILYVFKKPQIKGEGGLYPYRKYVYPLWICLPLLSAGLAFTNSQQGYITSGTFCYLPKRPYWYRLALAWIPRYLIFITIFVMYAVIWAYVNIKFRGFKGVGNSQYASGSHSYSISDKGQNRTMSKNFGFGAPPSRDVREDRRKGSANSEPDPLQIKRPPWENVSFITSKPLQDAGVAETDFAPDAEADIRRDTNCSSTETGRAASRHLSLQSTSPTHLPSSRKQSEVPTLNTTLTSSSIIEDSSVISTPLSGTPHTLKSTRAAIRRQLRLLFVYPLVYLLMWTFPFASHCLLYSDYYAAHPPFWLSIVTVASLSLQAGVDCIVFSWRERPWGRVEGDGGEWRGVLGGWNEGNERGEGKETAGKETREKRDESWWEAEGRKRKDSVWMGTEQVDRIIARQEGEEEEEEGGGKGDMEGEEEKKDS
jgi:G protein-coupled receptor GPR1